jgi:hypothetical protein
MQQAKSKLYKWLMLTEKNGMPPPRRSALDLALVTPRVPSAKARTETNLKAVAKSSWQA